MRKWVSALLAVCVVPTLLLTPFLHGHPHDTAQYGPHVHEENSSGLAHIHAPTLPAEDATPVWREIDHAVDEVSLIWMEASPPAPPSLAVLADETPLLMPPAESGETVRQLTLHIHGPPLRVATAPRSPPH
jgi:hypothetical protein